MKTEQEIQIMLKDETIKSLHAELNALRAELAEIKNASNHPFYATRSDEDLQLIRLAQTVVNEFPKAHIVGRNMYQLIADAVKVIDVYETAMAWFVSRVGTLLEEKEVLTCERSGLSLCVNELQEDVNRLEDENARLRKELDAAVEDCRRRDLEVKEVARALQIVELRLIREMFPSRFS